MHTSEHEKSYELVWHDLENDRAWFADHPDRQHRVRPLLWGEGTATHVKGRAEQVGRSWFIVRRDLEYATFTPVVAPIDDEELCSLLFKVHVGLGLPKSRYLKKAEARWIFLLEQMPRGAERDLALARLTSSSSIPSPHVRKTGGAADNVLAETCWQDRLTL